MLLDDMRDLLTTGGIAVPIYCGFMPDTPDRAIAVYETGGLAPAHAMGSPAVAVVENPRVQVVCRATEYDYQTARSDADAVFKLLDGMAKRTVNGVAYKWGEAVQSPFLLSRDNEGKPMVACNYQIVKELS